MPGPQFSTLNDWFDAKPRQLKRWYLAGLARSLHGPEYLPYLDSCFQGKRQAAFLLLNRMAPTVSWT